MNILEKTIAFLSPSKALARRLDRERLRLIERRVQRSQYAAAKTNRLTGPWTTSTGNVNAVIGNSSASIRARTRQLVRDFPYFANAVNRIVDHTVGAGIMFQSKIRGADQRLDKKHIQEVEDAFQYWADEADVAKKLHFYEMQALTKRQDCECGEFLLVKRFRPNEGRYIPYCLQVYEADWLTTQFDRGYGTHIMSPVVPGQPAVDIYQGIEYNRFTGQVIAYHFIDPDNWGNPVRIEAEDVIHGFDTLRPGQLRGISPFAAGLLLAHDLQEYMDAEIDTAKLAAKYLAFVKSPAPGGRQLGLGTDDDSEDQEYVEEMENAIIEYLNPGEEIEIASNPRPGSNFPPMVRLLLCMMSVTTGVPYEILSGDYQHLNYSTSRTARNDFIFHLRPIIARHVRQFCQRATLPFFDYAVMTGKLSIPNYFTNPHVWRRAEWQPPGMESIDPLRETKAWIDSTKAHIRSPQEVIRARGRDPEDVLREIQEFQEWEQDMGLTVEETSSAMANNPAAVEDQKSAKLLKIRR
jgi:lambda family phage portal protein